MLSNRSNIFKFALKFLRHNQESNVIIGQSCIISQRLLKTSSQCPATHAKWVMPHYMELKRRNDEMLKKGLIPRDRRSQYIEWNLDAELFSFGKRLNEEFDHDTLMTALLDESHIRHEQQQQQEAGLELIDGSALESNGALAAEGATIVRKVCQEFVQQSWPSAPMEAVLSATDYLCSQDVLSSVGQAIGLKDLVFAEPYPPSPAVMAGAACAVIATLARTSSASRAEVFVLDFVATHLVGKTLWDLWHVEDPVSLLQSILHRSGGSAEPRLVHQAGRNTLEASYQVAFYDQDRSFIGTGYGETIDIATTEAARDTLGRLFGDTSSRPALPFIPSLPLAHARLPHSTAVADTNTNPMLDQWTTDSADPRHGNVVVCCRVVACI